MTRFPGNPLDFFHVLSTSWSGSLRTRIRIHIRTHTYTHINIHAKRKAFQVQIVIVAGDNRPLSTLEPRRFSPLYVSLPLLFIDLNVFFSHAENGKLCPGADEKRKKIPSKGQNMWGEKNMGSADHPSMITCCP